MQKMGSPFNIVFYSTSIQKADSAANESFKLIDSINIICSDYDTSSELYKLRNYELGKPIKVSTILFELLIAARQAHKNSYGSFDITIGPLSLLWRNARKSHIFPRPGAIDTASALVGFRFIKLDTLSQTITFLKPGVQLDMGGIAKGYAADKVAALLKTLGITNALVDAGGDMMAMGLPPQKRGWRIGVNIPEQQEALLNTKLLLTNKAVATSGDAFQYMLHDGKKYAHIIDARTGYGVTFQRNVTVVSPNATTADWLATACSILPLNQVKILAKKYKSEVFITRLQNGRIRKISFGNVDAYWTQ
jgi:thiamine biosynthesis lipoprotein